jgi:hypothetical protein
MAGRRPAYEGFMKRTVLAFILGLVLGAWLFRDVQPRHPIAARRPNSPASYEEVLGYFGSAAMQRAPGVIPGVVMETDKSIALRMSARHFVVVPKRDIRDIGTLAQGDEPYVMDALAMIGRLARQEKIAHYQVKTNGPLEQSVRYLHFHLIEAEADTLRARP